MTEQGPPATEAQTDTDASTHGPFTDGFLDALGRWQRGWRRDREARGPIGAALEREAASLPRRFSEPRGPAYRKRHLYRTVDQGELAPLFLSGVLDEGGPTSWSTNRALIETLGDDASFGHQDVAAGAIFEHQPTLQEVIVDITALWDDEGFKAAVADYAARGGAEHEALNNFKARQAELVLRAPLQTDEIVALSRPGDFDSLAEAAGCSTEEQRAELSSRLHEADIRLEKAVILGPDATRRVIEKVVSGIRKKMTRWVAIRTPNGPPRLHGRRARARFGLRELTDLAQAVGSTDARLVARRKLPIRDGIMEARWSDGTIGYKDKSGRIWLR